MFAITPTDINWFTYLKEDNIISNVNFWTPTPWNVQGLKIGDKFFFMLKSPIRRLGGCGEFVRYQNLPVQEAWNSYGFGNGVQAKHELEERLKHYALKRSQKVQSGSFSLDSYQIGCVDLTNCHYWEEEHYKILEQSDISFPIQVVKLKYYKEDLLLSLVNDTRQKPSFSPFEEHREIYLNRTNVDMGNQYLSHWSPKLMIINVAYQMSIRQNYWKLHIYRNTDLRYPTTCRMVCYYVLTFIIYMMPICFILMRRTQFILVLVS